MNFRIWIEARVKKPKVQAGQGSLFDDPALDQPVQAPQAPPAAPEEPEAPVFTYSKPTSRPMSVDPSRKTPSGGIRYFAIPVFELLKKSEANPEKFFTIHSFKRNIEVKGLEKWGGSISQGNRRIVGYDKNGHRYLVARDPSDKVIWYPDMRMKPRIGI
jgi:hypothetical protein